VHEIVRDERGPAAAVAGQLQGRRV
jgi:hypothetical protein